MTQSVIEKILGLTLKQEDALTNLHGAFNSVFKNGMGAKKIAVALQDCGPAVPGEMRQWKPFAALYFDDELFSAFMHGDKFAVEEATFPSPKQLEPPKTE